MSAVAGPDDPARPRRLEWAVLLRRSWSLDVLTCPRCAGPMTMIAVIEDPRVARKILDHLGIPVRAPPHLPQRVVLQDPDYTDGIDPIYPD